MLFAVNDSSKTSLVLLLCNRQQLLFSCFILSLDDKNKTRIKYEKQARHTNSIISAGKPLISSQDNEGLEMTNYNLSSYSYFLEHIALLFHEFNGPSDRHSRESQAYFDQKCALMTL